MPGDEFDVHYVLCLIKVVALVVIASSLWRISNCCSKKDVGYATDRFGIAIQGNHPGSSAYLGPGYGSVQDQVGISGASQALFGNRYEPPTFWNIGDISTYEDAQHAAAPNLTPVAFDASGNPISQDSGSMSNPLGVQLKGYATPHRKGYATNLATSGGSISPYGLH